MSGDRNRAVRTASGERNLGAQTSANIRDFSTLQAAGEADREHRRRLTETRSAFDTARRDEASDLNARTEQLRLGQGAFERQSEAGIREQFREDRRADTQRADEDLLRLQLGQAHSIGQRFTGLPTIDPNMLLNIMPV
jgi:hypothetical protein